MTTFWDPAHKITRSAIHLHARIAHLENLLRERDDPGHRVELDRLKKAVKT